MMSSKDCRGQDKKHKENKGEATEPAQDFGGQVEHKLLELRQKEAEILKRMYGQLQQSAGKMSRGLDDKKEKKRIEEAKKKRESDAREQPQRAQAKAFAATTSKKATPPSAITSHAAFGEARGRGAAIHRATRPGRVGRLAREGARSIADCVLHDRVAARACDASGVGQDDGVSGDDSRSRDLGQDLIVRKQRTRRARIPTLYQ